MMTAEFLQKERQKMMIAQLAGGRCRDLKRDKNIKIDIKNGNIYISTCRREMQGSMSARFPPNRHSHTPSISTSQVRLSYILALHIIYIIYHILLYIINHILYSHPTATVIPHQSQHYRSDCHTSITHYYSPDCYTHRK